MPIMIELVPPEKANIRVCLMASSAVRVLKGVRAQLALLYF